MRRLYLGMHPDSDGYYLTAICMDVPVLPGKEMRITEPMTHADTVNLAQRLMGTKGDLSGTALAQFGTVKVFFPDVEFKLYSGL